MRLKRLARFSISRHTARHSRCGSPAHAAQVLQATMDFGRNDSIRRGIWIKHLKRRAFLLSSPRRTLQPAFTSPQRA
jgi:hypothetical protein